MLNEAICKNAEQNKGNISGKEFYTKKKKQFSTQK